MWIDKMEESAGTHLLTDSFLTNSRFKLFYFRAVQYWFKVLDNEPIYDEDGVRVVEPTAFSTADEAPRFMYAFTCTGLLEFLKL